MKGNNMDRKYSPSLLWILATSYYREKILQQEDFPSCPLALYIYKSDENGAYAMQGPILYFQDTPFASSLYAKVKQTALYDDREKLKEVVIWDKRLKKTVVIGRTYEEAWKKITD
jgi:hypothetical protein